MGISYYNGSGYPDPTAHLAVRHIEEEEKMLHINYPTGHMDIRMDKFFPAPLDRAKKLFRLMAQYCSRDEQIRLFQYLASMRQKLKDREVSYQIRAAECEKKMDAHRYTSLAKKAATEHQRAGRNMELLCQICGLEVSE